MSSVGRSLRRRVPEPLKPALRAVAEGVDALVGLVDRRRVADGPVPPRRIRASVGQPSRRRYRAEGRLVAEELERLLEGLKRPLSSFEAICDLASGPGKVLCRLDLPAGSSVAAIDVNGDAIEWLRARLPGVDARAEGSLPPTSFVDASFDLLFSISLFTHLPEDRQDRWLAEVGRVLKLGGTGVVTVHGRTAYEGFRSGSRPGISAPQLRRLREAPLLDVAGFVFEPEPRPGRRSPGIDEAWGLAFHDEAYVREHWSRFLEVETVLPGALNFRQDAVIVRGR